MANNVYTSRIFASKAKRLLKKYKTLHESLDELEKELIKNPYMGSPYGSKIYKVRVSDESKGSGKSGGFRVITYVVEEVKDNIEIFLVTIFDKSEESSIKKQQALELVKKCGLL